MDQLFRDALACRLAAEFCNRLTGKQGKKNDMLAEYKTFIAEAANVDAIENPSPELPESDLISCRE
jgi:hypothetical protein